MHRLVNNVTCVQTEICNIGYKTLPGDCDMEKKCGTFGPKCAKTAFRQNVSTIHIFCNEMYQITFRREM